MLFALFLSNDIVAQNAFIRSYNVFGNSYGGSIEQTYDLGYITSGAYIDTVQTQWGWTAIEIVSLVKTDSAGKAQWIKSYNLGANCAYGGGATQTYDHGYIYATTYTDSLGNNPDAFVFKTDSVGNVKWSKSYGGLGMEYSMGIVQTPDSNFVVAAYSNSHTLVNGDAYLIKIDRNGILQAGTAIDFKDYSDFPVSIQRSQTGYLICANSYYADTTGAYDSRILVIKTNWNCQPIWCKAFGVSNKYLSPYNLRETKQKDILVTGMQQDSTGYKTGLFLMRTDSSGNPLFSKQYWLSDSLYSYCQGYSVVENHDDTYLVCGLMTDNNYIMKSTIVNVDKNGIVKTCHIIPDTFKIIPTYIGKSNDKGTIMTGTEYNTGLLANIKTDSLGKISCNDAEISIKSANVQLSIDSGFSVYSLGTETARPVYVKSITPFYPIACLGNDSVVVDTTPVDPPIPVTETIVSLPSIAIPNIFSPNGDNVNEFWTINYEGYTNFDIVIYNRWGEKVCEGADPKPGWNGRLLNKGIACTDGTYYYIVKCKNTSTNIVERYHGYLSLIK